MAEKSDPDTAAGKSPWRKRVAIGCGALLALTVLGVLGVVVGGIMFRGGVSGTLYWIPSEAMRPTFEVGDRVRATDIDNAPVERGAIVVYKRPEGFGDLAAEVDTKRVIGLPGEIIEGRDGAVLVNGTVLSEPYLAPNTTTGDFSPKTLGGDEFFLLGDNRPNSSDSRFHGPVPRSSLKDQVEAIVSPMDRRAEFR